MKKIIDFIKSKEREDAPSDIKKAAPKEEKKLASPAGSYDLPQRGELFLDDSDIGYC